MQNRKRAQMYRTDFWTLWEKERVGRFKRTASKHVYYLGWNRSPVEGGCMRQVLGPGALGRPRGIGWRGRWEGGSGWGTHATPWLIHNNVWQNPLQCCEVISLQLIKINEKKKKSSCQCRGHRRPGFNPWIRKIPGGGNGNPLQYSSLENSMDGGAWRSAAHRVTESWTRLSNWAQTHNPLVTTNLISVSMSLFVCLWSIIDLQHYASSWCTIQWFNISIHFKTITIWSSCQLSPYKDTT